MDYKLLNKIEEAIKRCYYDPPIAYELTDVLKGEEVSAYDWSIICAAIQAGMAAATSKAIRILAVHLDLIDN